MAQSHLALRALALEQAHLCHPGAAGILPAELFSDPSAGKMPAALWGCCLRSSARLYGPANRRARKQLLLARVLFRTIGPSSRSTARPSQIHAPRITHHSTRLTHLSAPSSANKVSRL